MIDEAPLISVVLPCYNHGRFLKKAIKSVFSNCSRKLELIIINDGSTDQTSNELKELESDSRITIIEQENIGLAESLNKGFKIARGQYLTWTSADNLYQNFALDKLSFFLDNNPTTDLVYSDVELIDENSKLLFNSSYRIANQDQKNSSVLRLPQQPDTLALYADNFINACFMYRSWVPKLLGGYRKELLGFEDYEYWLRILAIGNISHLGTEDVLYQYRIHQQSLTAQINAEKLSLEQRKMVASYGKLVANDNLWNSKTTENPQKVILSSNKLSNDFLESLPLRYTGHNTSNSTLDFSIDTPRILSRINRANYRSFELNSGSKAAVTLLLPDFLTDQDLNYYSNLIKNNQKLTFVSLCCNHRQSNLAQSLKDLNSQNSKNLKVIDLTKSPLPQDDLLPEEGYLPFVYALSGSSAIICETNDENVIAHAVISLAAAAKIHCILLSEKQLTSGFPQFCTLNSKEFLLKNNIDLKNITFTEATFSSWLSAISAIGYQEKQHKLINFKKHFNFTVS